MILENTSSSPTDAETNFFLIIAWVCHFCSYVLTACVCICLSIYAVLRFVQITVNSGRIFSIEPQVHHFHFCEQIFDSAQPMRLYQQEVF